MVDSKLKNFRDSYALFMLALASLLFGLPAAMNLVPLIWPQIAVVMSIVAAVLVYSVVADPFNERVKSGKQ